MSNVAFIPVRGGSTSIPLKNIKPMCGKPLVYWAVAAAAASEHVGTVYVATDSDAIREAVVKLSIPKVEVVGRSAETATATASSESALLEFAERHDFDAIAFIQATSPLLNAADIDRAFEMLERGECDSVLSVVEDKHFYWQKGKAGAAEVNYNVYARPRRQDFNGWYQENGAVYVTTRERLLESRNRVSGRIGLLEMAPETAFEIDEPSDWDIVEALLARRQSQQAEQTTSKCHVIKLFLTDCDGCLTDGGMYYGEDGSELKKFNTRDGVAFQILQDRGIKVGIITGEKSLAVQKRAEKLSCDYVVLDCKDKISAVRSICELNGIDLSEVVYVGDDLNDLSSMNAIHHAGGLAACPNNATEIVQDAADIVLANNGGHGVIRELVDLLIADGLVVNASL